MKYMATAFSIPLLTLLLCFVPLVHVAGQSLEIPLATSTAAESIDPSGSPMAALEGGITASLWLAEDSSTRLKMQWLDAAGQALFEMNGRDIAGDGGDISAASILRRPGGGAFVAYSQLAASGAQHFYAQAFNSAGAPLWPGDGVRVSDLPDSQSDVTLAADFAGGAYACFTVRAEAIQCQHLDRDGDRLWTESGLDVGGSPGPKIHPQAVYDGAEGLLVFWHNRGLMVAEGPEEGAIEGQHFNSPGFALWGDGLKIRNIFWPDATAITPNILAAISDGQGGAFLTFEAGLTPTSSDLDVIMQRVSGAGNILWEDHRPVIADNSHTRHESLISAPDGGFVVVTSEPAGEFGGHLRLFRVDPQGFHLWGEQGVPLSDPASLTLNAFPQASFDGGILRVAWTRQLAALSVEMDIYLARFALDGTRLGAGADELVTSASNSQFCQGLVHQDSPPRTLVLWEDLRKDNPDDVDIYASELSAQTIFASGFELGDLSSWEVVVGH